MLRRQIEAGREFRQQAEAYWGAGEQWADVDLDRNQATLAAEKKGSAKASGRKSGMSLKRS